MRGLTEATQTPVEVDLREVTVLEVRELNGWLTFAAVTTGIFVIVIAVGLAASQESGGIPP